MQSANQNRFSPGLASMVWFAAAVSITEIMTGALFAPLGWQKGLAAVLLGHALGGVLFFAAALIGARTGASAMQTVRLPFGRRGSYWFAGLNVIQLAGWTAIMIYVAAKVLVQLSAGWHGGEGISFSVWCLIIGALVILWIYAGFWKYFNLFNIPVLALLFVVCCLISLRVFGSGSSGPPVQPAAGVPISFNEAVELAVAMPLSWLPLVADYTRHSTRPLATPLAATLAYGLGSSWMYAVGLGAAIFSGKTEIASILQYAGPGAAALLTVVLATVTTTFLDAWSGAMSASNICSKLPLRLTASAVTVLGAVLAMLFPVDRFEPFLYCIGAVFIPMIAVQIVDFFWFRNRQAREGICWPNMAAWLAGFLLYLFLTYGVELTMSPSLIVAAVTMVLTWLIRICLGQRF